MAINASVTNEQIAVSVGETQIDVSVAGGVGPTGSSGVVAVTAPLTNSGTSTSANVGLSVGTGLAVSGGSLVVSYGSQAGVACQGNDARLSDSREWTAATVTQADAEAGTSTDRRAFTALRVFQAIAAWWAASAAKTKLDGIASGATANQTDAYLLSRANHTGTQAWSTITSTPTTRAGYGISDAAASSHTHATSDITWQAITGWNASTSYTAGALVSKDGVAYRAAAAHTSGMTFNPLDWLAVTPFSFPASHIAAGTIDVARLPVGTTSTTVAAGDHTHAQLHDRSHAITSSSDHTATAWRVFYSNGSGVVTELTLGSAGQALLSNGASAAPSWGSAGSNSASDLSQGTLANARLTTRARASMNLYLWSTFR